MSMTESEINSALADYISARTAILKGGQSYNINSGGSSRSVTMADLAMIENQIRIYYQMLEELNGDKGFVLRAGW